MGGAIYLLGIPVVMTGIWLWKATGMLPDELARSLDPMWVMTTMVLSLCVAILAATLIHYSWTMAEAGVLLACLQAWLYPIPTRPPMPGKTPKALGASGVIGRGLAAIVVPVVAINHSWTPLDLSLTLLLAMACLAASKAAWAEASVQPY